MNPELLSYAFQGDWSAVETVVTAAVKNQLRTIQNEEPDSLLLEYVLVMIGNKKTIEEISKELNDFLGEKEALEFCIQLGNYLISNYPNIEKTQIIKSPSRVAAKKPVAIVKSQVHKPTPVAVPAASSVTLANAPSVKEVKASSVKPAANTNTNPEGGITLADLRKRRLENIKGEIVISSSTDVAQSKVKRQKAANLVEAHVEVDDGDMIDGDLPVTQLHNEDPTQGQEWHGFNSSSGGRFGGRGAFHGRFAFPPFGGRGGRGRGRAAFPHDPNAVPPAFHPAYYPAYPVYPPTYPPQFAESHFPGRGGRGGGRGRGRGDESVDVAFEAYTSKNTSEEEAVESEIVSAPTEAPTPVTGRGWAGRTGGGRGRGRGFITKPINKTWVRDIAAKASVTEGSSSIPDSDATTSAVMASASSSTLSAVAKPFHPASFGGYAPRPFAPRPFAPRPFAPRPTAGLAVNKKWVRESDIETALTSGR